MDGCRVVLSPLENSNWGNQQADTLPLVLVLVLNNKDAIDISTGGSSDSWGKVRYPRASLNNMNKKMRAAAVV